MTDEKLEQLIRDNERMRTALKLIGDYAQTAVMGMWRQRIYEMACRGLGGLR